MAQPPHSNLNLLLSLIIDSQRSLNLQSKSLTCTSNTDNLICVQEATRPKEKEKMQQIKRSTQEANSKNLLWNISSAYPKGVLDLPKRVNPTQRQEAHLPKQVQKSLTLNQPPAQRHCDFQTQKLDRVQETSPVKVNTLLIGTSKKDQILKILLMIPRNQKAKKKIKKKYIKSCRIFKHKLLK